MRSSECADALGHVALPALFWDSTCPQLHNVTAWALPPPLPHPHLHAALCTKVLLYPRPTRASPPRNLYCLSSTQHIPHLCRRRVMHGWRTPTSCRTTKDWRTCTPNFAHYAAYAETPCTFVCFVLILGLSGHFRHLRRCRAAELFS